MRRLLALALLSLLPTLAAAKGPWAEVDGSFANPAHKDEVNLLIRGVNDRQYEPMRSHVTVKPGPLWLTVTSTRASSGGGVTAIPYVFKAEPCMRYLLAAQHDGISNQRFTVLVVAIERIGECKLPEGVAEPATFHAPTPDATVPPPPAPVAPAAETGATSY